MHMSKPILHTPSSQFDVARPAPLPSLAAVLRSTALIAAFVFVGACVLGAI